MKLIVLIQCLFMIVVSSQYNQGPLIQKGTRPIIENMFGKFPKKLIPMVEDHIKHMRPYNGYLKWIVHDKIEEMVDVHKEAHGGVIEDAKQIEEPTSSVYKSF